ncbi:unnamed protein product [Tilletia caries]|nr:unnamed protein product [Tilletia caries]
MPLPTPTPSVRKSSRANERPGIAAMRPITDSPQSSRTQSTFGGGKGAPRRTLDRDIPTLEEDDHDSSYEDDDDDQYVDEQDTDARFSDNETERQYHARQGSRQPGSSDAPMGLLAPSARGLAASAMEPGFPSHPGTMRRTASSQTHDRLTARDSARDVRAQRVEPQEYSYLENGRDPMMSEKKSRRPASIASRSSSAADFYRRTQAKTDLNFWEPSTRVAQISRTLHGPISNLPDWTSLRGTELTSHPVSHVQQDVEYSIMHASLLGSLRTTFALQHQLDGVHSYLMQTLFNSAFQRFIQASITEQSRVRLGAFASDDNGDGLGAAFVLTNPRLRDHPIVLVSPAFCDLTGYPQEAILQRNCRFLQGPSTSPASVQRIRDALNSGGSSIELLLNYKRNGEPFWNLLCIIPLRDAKGRVQYFVGGQVNVTGALTSHGLSFLLGGGRPYEKLPDPETTRRYGVEVSPTLLKYYSPNPKDLPSDYPGQKQADDVSIRTRGKHAAGAQTYGQKHHSPPLYQNTPSQHDLNTNTKNGNGGLMKRLFVRRKPSASQSLGRTAEVEAQRAGGTIEEHIDDFATTYSRLALIKRDKREVLFVTSTLLQYFDLPTETLAQIYESPLLHADLLSLICGEDRSETRRVRANVQDAIRTGKTLKIAVKIRQPARSLFGSGAVLKSSVLHISPMKDVENNPSAAIVVFA